MDKDNSGDLDAKDLKQSKLRVSHPVIWESDPTLWQSVQQADALYCTSTSRAEGNFWDFVLCGKTVGIERFALGVGLGLQETLN